MEHYSSIYPLLGFMDDVKAWIEEIEWDGFWRYAVIPETGFEDLRKQAKELIIWMELKGYEQQACKLDYSMRCLREAIWEFEESCKGEISPSEDDIRESLRFKMAEEASKVAGCAEDINDETSLSIWEEYRNA